MAPNASAYQDFSSSSFQATGDDGKPISDGFASMIAPQSMTVLGIYGRAPIPRRETLPEKPKASDKAKDQTFCRRRLRVKPIFEDEECTDASEESANQSKHVSEECPANEKVADKVNVEPTNEGYEAALFIPGHGLVGSEMYHTKQNLHGWDDPTLEERAILFQSIENYAKIMSNPDLAVYALPQKLLEVEGEEGDAHTRFDKSNDEHVELILDNISFGEQVVVRGVEASGISVGDIFEVEGGLSPLVVEVSSPRLPCTVVDRKHGSPFGMKGMRRYCMTHALAGWFTRVLVPGELRPGMVLTRTAHPYPKWTMTEISKALYSEGNRLELAKSKAHWKRSIEELRELHNLEPLGWIEWRWEAEKLLTKMEEEREKEEAENNETNKKRAESSGSFFERLTSSFNGACDVWCSASDLLFYCEPSPEEVAAA
mmetsp:Transcript_7949/g.11689  ORF Transcript_7949/g.11689 Transcript_7949/m.11689 type:complete len:429 (+) Transcript_7949:40-1326(+)